MKESLQLVWALPGSWVIKHILLLEKGKNLKPTGLGPPQNISLISEGWLCGIPFLIVSLKEYLISMAGELLQETLALMNPLYPLPPPSRFGSSGGHQSFLGEH